MAITNKQREILDHTAHGAAGGFYCGDSVDMQVLVRMGLMVSMGKKSFCPDEYFALTAAGRKTLSAFNLVFSSCCKHFKAQIALQAENARLKALLEHSKTQLEYEWIEAENAKLQKRLEVLKVNRNDLFDKNVKLKAELKAENEKARLFRLEVQEAVEALIGCEDDKALRILEQALGVEG